MSFLKVYVVSLIVFLILDSLWLGIIAKNLYQKELGFLLATEVRWMPIVLFYLLYTAGLVHFALLPTLQTGSYLHPLLQGAFFGLVAYATYDLTNFATVKNWPQNIVIYDLIWGAFISGATCFITYLIANHWKNSFQ